MNFFREIVVALPAELFLLQKHNDKKFVKVQHPIKGFLIFWCFFEKLCHFSLLPTREDRDLAQDVYGGNLRTRSTLTTVQWDFPAV